MIDTDKPMPYSVVVFRDLDNIQLEVTLHTPVAMEKGLRFAIREGGRTVGAGTISEIIK